MQNKNLKISSSIDARNVALLVQMASKFTSNIRMKINEKDVNVKSIMGLIALGELDGKDINIIADGEDEERALKEISEFLTR